MRQAAPTPAPPGSETTPTNGSLFADAAVQGKMQAAKNATAVALRRQIFHACHIMVRQLLDSTRCDPGMARTSQCLMTGVLQSSFPTKEKLMRRLVYVYVSAAALAAATLAACDKGPAPQANDLKSAPAPEQAQAPKQGEEFRSTVTPGPAPAGAPAADSELSNKVRQVLTSKPDMKIGGVEVAAANGVVTLYGTVDEAAEKDRAALLAMEIEGVRSVVNRLVVVRGS